MDTFIYISTKAALLPHGRLFVQAQPLRMVHIFGVINYSGGRVKKKKTKNFNEKKPT
jgi:hypothetical protein